LFAGAVLAIGQAGLHSRSYDLAVLYDPVAIQAVRGSPAPRVPAITGVVERGWNVAHSRDAFVLGNSQRDCYEPMFGYRRERLVTSTIHEGPALDEFDGSFNFKNPACYVFPEENHCRPGDNFPTFQRVQLEALLQRRPFAFAISSRQAAANVLSITTWALLGLGLVALAVRRLVGLSRPKASTRP